MNIDEILIKIYMEPHQLSLRRIFNPLQSE